MIVKNGPFRPSERPIPHRDGPTASLGRWRETVNY